MTTPFFTLLNINTSVSKTIVSISLMLFSGFLATRVTKKLRLPNVTGYILAGIALGPFCFNIIPQSIVSGMDFIADIALAFIAFSTGEFFQFETLKKNGMKVIIITIFEALLASILVFIVCYFLLGVDYSFSLVLASLAAATAPASTVMTIRQLGASGDFVDTLLQVVALDDVVGLIAFSLALSLAGNKGEEAFSLLSVLKPLALNILIFILGGAFGLLLKFLLHNRSTDNRLIVSIAVIFSFCGICAMFDISPLLGCMSMAMIYINTTEDERLFKQLNYFTPPILLLFFVRSGLNFDLGSLFGNSESISSVPLLLIGIIYFITRIVGKYGGAYIGCWATKKDKRVRNYLGLSLIPQAGVAIGLASLGARTLGGVEGDALETIILASSVLYELIGPGCSKLALYLSHSYPRSIEEVAPTIEKEGKSELEILIERIHSIQNDLPKHRSVLEEEEDAFSEAADEHFAATMLPKRTIKFK